MENILSFKQEEWKNMEDEKRRKKRKRIAVIVLLVVAALVYGAVSDRQGNAVEVVRGEESADSTGRETEAGDRLQDGNEEQEDGEEKENAEIYVDVGGAVVHPGVVNIAEGSRVFEAVQAAGGTTSEAETKYINMASECTDGQKLYIPTAEEAEKAAENGESAELFSTDFSDGDPAGTEREKVNVNTATSEELQTLDGIGPSMAQRIIEYRQANGNFKAVEDLTNVSGIGEKTLEKLIPDVCV